MLIVEDDVGDAYLTGELIAESGDAIEVSIVQALSEAIVRLAEGFACVLLDLGLPDASGIDALQAILEAAPGVAVIVLTGHDDHELAFEAVAAGAQDYLNKGTVDGVALTRSIRYAVERKRSMETARQLLAHELVAAESARLERGLLPRPIIFDESLRTATRYRSGGSSLLLGGDFYDAVERPDGTVRVVIGDVAGHSADEAAIGVALRIAWRGLVLADLDDDSVLPGLEAVLESERPDEGLFATVCHVVIAPDRGSMVVRSAGHPAPLLLDDTPRELALVSPGPPVGAFRASRWPAEEIALPHEWLLFFYTDGVIEGRSLADRSQRFGVDGLLRAVGSGPWDRHDLGRLAESVVEFAEAENGGRVEDDIALLLLASLR